VLDAVLWSGTLDHTSKAVTRNSLGSVFSYPFRSFLANVNSRSRSLYVVVRPSVCRLSVVCRLSSVVCNVRAPYSQPIEIFGNVSTPFGILAICDLSIKILRRSSQGNPSIWGLNQRGVEKCSDFGPLEDCISETVQDKR